MMKKIYLIIAVLALSISVSKADIPDGIVQSLKNGNAAELTKFFNVNVDLTIFDKQDIYSKTQAEILLKDFFSKNVPSNFIIIHQGGKEDTQYYIGKLTTSTGTYRVTIIIKAQGKTSLIQQFKIEKENG
jgi:hypothetical protein